MHAEVWNWLPKLLGVDTDAMFMRSSVRHAQRWSWGLIVAWLLAVATVAYAFLGYLAAKNQSGSINDILVAVNQTASSAHAGQLTTAYGAMGIVVAMLAATLGLIGLLVTGAQLLRSIQKDDANLTSSCKARLEKMRGLYVIAGEDVVGQVILNAKVFTAEEAPKSLAELREEVDKCIRILEKIERASNVLHGGQDPRG